jgi:hypothetical protein
MSPKLLVLAALAASLGFAQRGSPPSAEALSYRVEWGLLTAGKARMDWTAVQQPPGYQAKLHLETAGLASKVYTVMDDYVVNSNRDMCAVASQFLSNEGSRHRDTRITYESKTNKAIYFERDRAKNAVVSSHTIDVPPGVHDVLGALYDLRTLNLGPGQSTQIAITDGKKAAMAKVQAQERENISVPAGSFKTIRYEIFVFDNVLYRRSAHLYVWLTDDARKLPVQIRVKMQIVAIGTITFELEWHG